MNSTNREKLQKIIFTIFSFYLINENMFEKYSSLLEKFSLVNIMIVICVLLSIVNFSKIIDEKVDLEIVGATICFIFLVSIGIISSLVYKNQPITVSMLDVFLFSRFMFIYIFFMLFMEKEKTVEYQSILIKIFKFITVINFVLLILNLLLNFLPIFDIRYGFPSQRLLYTHPTYLGSISFFCWYFLKPTKDDIPYQIMSTILVLSTLRTKLIFLMLLFYTVKIILGNTQTIGFKNLFSLAFSGVGLIVLFKNQLDSKLLTNESSMRNILMSKARLIAKEYFPLGSGFGTYGSFVSFRYYSPLYESLGMNKMYGFTENYYIYGMDSYYSLLIAQFGYIGLLFFVLMLLFIILEFVNLRYFELKKYIFITYIIVSCFTESTLTSSVGILFFVILAFDSKKMSTVDKTNAKLRSVPH